MPESVANTLHLHITMCMGTSNATVRSCHFAGGSRERQGLPSRNSAKGLLQTGVIGFDTAEVVSWKSRIHYHSQSEYEPAAINNDSFQYSHVLDCSYRLERTRNRYGRLQYALVEQPR